MQIEIKKFGKMLLSRPAGKEAFAVASSYGLLGPLARALTNQQPSEIILDFEGVDVLSPSWADEFITGIKNTFKTAKIKFINTENPSVKTTLEILAKTNY